VSLPMREQLGGKRFVQESGVATCNLSSICSLCLSRHDAYDSNIYLSAHYYAIALCHYSRWLPWLWRWLAK